MSKADRKIRAALRVLNASVARVGSKAGPGYRLITNKPDLRCPVCGKADCALPWNDKAHEQNPPVATAGQ